MTPLSAIVVDDDADIRELMEEMLPMININVVATGMNGNDAIRLYREKSPSLVFLDINMPELDGITALREIKRIDPESTVIMVTGNTDSDLESTLQSLNANALIRKPFSIENIVKIIENIQQSNTMIIQDA
ncbi:response regulator [Nitrosopumilus sp. S6]